MEHDEEIVIMKGSVTDLPFIMVLVMTLGMVGVIMALILSNVHDVWPVAGQSKDILNVGIGAMQSVDYAVAIIAVGLSIFSIGSALYIRTHPIFFIFSIILLMILVLISAVFTNVMDAFLTAAPIITMANNFPITVTLVRSFPLFCLVIGLIISVVMYSKSEESSGGGI